jgi:hypothetical protein
MFAAMLFTIAILALCQFALFYWRAVVSGVASQPVSDRVLEAAHLESGEFCGADFERLATLLGMTPELKNGNSKLGLVGGYYSLVQSMSAAFGRMSPAVASWSERESVLCARYAAAQIERRLQANLAQVASIRSC